MGTIIMPKHTADRDYIFSALKVYYINQDWLPNSDYKNKLYDELYRIGKETQRNSDGTHYTKCSENLRYFGLLERRIPGKINSDVRITESGKKFYEAISTNDFNSAQDVIMTALETMTFGRNNEGCGSNSDIEPPCVYMLSSILLNGITNKEFAYILGQLNNYNLDLSNALGDVLLKRGIRNSILTSTVTSDIKFIGFLKLINFLETSGDLTFISPGVLGRFAERLVSLPIRNSADNLDGFVTYNHNADSIGLNDIKSKNIFEALRTKPFLLLAGISGTGKSRIVRELAFQSCPTYLRDTDGTTPGNYCMIEVKPNWHDSSELLGYYSNISKKYIFTKFVKFLVRATMHPTVPFFVCLDEMNLAPVEQYFAEFLSVLETRKLVSGSVVSGNLVKPECFTKTEEREIGGILTDVRSLLTDKDWFYEFYDRENISSEEQGIVDSHTDQNFAQKGLSLPENVFIIGTVNMDDTTHQFSRKVIDRAMTIEMNGGKLEDMFGGSEALTYPTQPDNDILSMTSLRAKYVSADDVLSNCDRIKNDADAMTYVTGKDSEGNIVEADDTLPKRLYAINKILENTPFQVSYRVFNELVIYLAVLLDEDTESRDLKTLADIALDKIMLMKILPRIEGDYEMFNPNGELNKLEELKKLFADGTDSHKKLEEMIKRLETTEFTRFWP